MVPPDATGGDGNSTSSHPMQQAIGDDGNSASSDPMQQDEKVATMAQQQLLAVTTQKKKPKRRKKLKPSSSPAAAHQQQQRRHGDGEGSIGHLQQQQRGRPRVVWDDKLQDAFVKAYNALGEDAVPKKILAMMNVEGVSRANVASHLQKHRLSLKREEQSISDKGDKRGCLKREKQSIPDKGDKRAPLHAEANSSQMPLPSPHPPPAQSPPTAATNLRIHPCPDFPMVQPIQRCFTPPLEATVPMVQPIQQCFTPPDLEAIIAVMMPQKLVEKQGAGRDATALLQAATAAASGYNPMQAACQDVSITGGGMLFQAVSMTGEEVSVPEAKICMAQLQMAANAEEVQGGAAQPGAAEMAAKAEEGQGSMDPPGTSVVHAYWKIDDDNEVSSWDFGFFPWNKID